MNIKKTLGTIALASALFLPGCNYQISQEGVDSVTEHLTENWVKTTDNYTHIHRLLAEEKYEDLLNFTRG